MGNFVIAQYSGEDAGVVLLRVLAGMGMDEELDNPDEHEVESETERVVGFSRNPEPVPEIEKEEPDEPDSD